MASSRAVKTLITAFASVLAGLIAASIYLFLRHEAVMGLGKGVLVVTVVALAGLVVGIAYALPQWMWWQGPTTQGLWTVWGMPMQWNGMMGGGCPLKRGP